MTGVSNPDKSSAQRGILVIALAAATGSASVTLWFPFLPLFLMEIGARDNAEAAFWLSIALMAQGIGRLLAGPVWGVIADRIGRKKMFLRALFATGFVTLGTCFVTAPWQLIISLCLFGLLSGFNPAAVALASVSVPDARLKSTIAKVTGGQYLGHAIGPGLGAIFALLVGFRGSLAVSGLAVIVVAMTVLRYVPADRVGAGSGTSSESRDSSGRASAPMEPFRITLQLAIAVTVFGILFGLNGFRSVSTAIALKEIDPHDVIAHTGVAFALVGLASALGILLVSTPIMRQRRLSTVLATASVLSACVYGLLARSDSVGTFVVALTAASLLNAAMIPATNTLIAMNAARSRRGTAFGLASAAQAMGTMAGPLAAAAFTATSLQMGFSVIGLGMLCLAMVIFFAVREPQGEQPPSVK